LLLLPPQVQSSDKEVLEKVAEYFDIVGISERINNSVHECISMTSEMMGDPREALEVILTNNASSPNLTESELIELSALIEKAQSRFIVKHCNTKRPDEDLEILKEEYARYVTLEDMDAIIEFAKSPPGQKDTLASSKGVEAAYIRIFEARKHSLKRAEEFTIEIANIVSEFLINKNAK